MSGAREVKKGGLLAEGWGGNTCGAPRSGKPSTCIGRVCLDSRSVARREFGGQGGCFCWCCWVLVVVVMVSVLVVVGDRLLGDAAPFIGAWRFVVVVGGGRGGTNDKRLAGGDPRWSCGALGGGAKWAGAVWRMLL